jgi:hypothetical protein
VKEAHLAKIIKVDLQSDLFTYNIDEQALRQAELLDGKLLLRHNFGQIAEPNPQAKPLNSTTYISHKQYRR